MMFNDLETTIAAIATPAGVGGVAVVRLSGPHSWAVTKALMQHPKRLADAGRVVVDWLVDTRDGQVLDQVVLLPFRAPNSYTGQDVVEIQTHGGRALVQLVLQRCLAAGATLAHAGEFTHRAMVCGRLNLTQTESVLDLIHAQGERMVKLAAHNMHQRTLAGLLERYWQAIQTIQADMVAHIDFPDEVDEPDRGVLQCRLKETLADVQVQLALNHRSQPIRDGLRVALGGAPNAGKSSLFNRLLQSERAIVTPQAGTTRDTLTETMLVAGVPVTLVDTAGLRTSTDDIEQQGVARARHAMAESALTLIVADLTQPVPVETWALLEQAAPILWVWHKVDLIDCAGAGPVDASRLDSRLEGVEQCLVSSHTGQGIEAVLDWIGQQLDTLPDIGELGYLLSQRQIRQLEAVAVELQGAVDALAQPRLPLDLATVPLTNALLLLQELLGRDASEAVLDTVYARFCVGK
ncbi:MAG: tRNA uridine-5-carboxymethylaminomethyl(34) synthesis GTPase MnmE [Cyanobacteria bacterium HKST-UBA03]|nr:tRNA uridine-5-carboxymethylaminomethyl(34) synthesis GTPase MnmE [Cyanobacteria bacterium HKST-UBA03]